VLIANSNLVGTGRTGTNSNRLERLGLTMYGQMTAGSWIYIGSQGIVQGTFETLAAVARRPLRRIAGGQAGGVGRHGRDGGAQPLAAVMNGACFLGIDVDPDRIRRRLDTGYCDRLERSLDAALAALGEAQARDEAISLAWWAIAPTWCGAGAARNSAGCSHRPDQRARSAEWLRAAWHDAAEAARCEPPIRRICRALDRVHGCARRGHAGTPEARRGDLRLRQQHTHHAKKAGVEHAFTSRFSCPIYTPAVLPGPRPLPLGGAIGRPGR